MDEKEIIGLAQAGEKIEEKAEQKDEKKEQKPPEPYPIFGTDQVVNEAELIIYAKYRMKMMIMKYKLVGSVNNNGQYVISDEIKHDLVKMEKEISDSGELFYKASALYMKKHFHYYIRIETKENGMAKASLFLSEWVDNYLGNEYIVTHVADYEGLNNEEFRIKVRKVFHLVDVAVKVDDTAVPELAVQMQDLFDLNLIVGDLYEMACQIYVAGLIKLLEGSGDIGKGILEEYRHLLGKKNIQMDDKYRFIAYKGLLDHLIDKRGGFKKIGLDMARVNLLVNELNKSLLQIDKSTSKGPLEKMTTTVAQKAAGKASKGGKKGGNNKGSSKTAGNGKKSKSSSGAGKDAKGTNYSNYFNSTGSIKEEINITISSDSGKGNDFQWTYSASSRENGRTINIRELDAGQEIDTQGGETQGRDTQQIDTVDFDKLELEGNAENFSARSRDAETMSDENTNSKDAKTTENANKYNAETQFEGNENINKENDDFAKGL